jgi:hypothetical protein
MALDSLSVHTSAVLTADGVIGTSGAETIIYALVVMGGSATTLCAIHEGTSSSGTKRSNSIAPVNDSHAIYFGPQGIYFPSGAYLDITTTGGTVTVVYNQ